MAEDQTGKRTLPKQHPALKAHWQRLDDRVRAMTLGEDSDFVGSVRAWSCAVHYCHEYQLRFMPRRFPDGWHARYVEGKGAL